MTEVQEEKLKEVLSHLVSAQNCLLFESRPNLISWKNHFDEATKIFKENFPERPESDIEEIASNCRGLWSDLTRTPYMTTFTGERDIWAKLMSK